MVNLSFEQLLVLLCGCFLFIGLIIGWTSGWYWYKYTPEKKQNPIPTCFGEIMTPTGEAENGCEDCHYNVQCEAERMNKQNG